MTIVKEKNGTNLVMKVSGRLDTSTAPSLEEEINANIADVTDFTLDFNELEYVSSAGLRVLLMAQKIMNKQGTMVVANVCDDIAEVFEITGFPIF